MPKINNNSSLVLTNKDSKIQRKSFSFFKDNTNNSNISHNSSKIINNKNINLNNSNLYRKKPFRKKIIKNYFALSQTGKTINGVTKTNQDSYLVLTKINNFSNFNAFWDKIFFIMFFKIYMNKMILYNYNIHIYKYNMQI